MASSNSIHVVALICLLVALLFPNETTVLATSSPTVNNKKFIGANWKCSLETTDEVDKLVGDLNHMWKSMGRAQKAAVELCVNPPYVFLDRVRSSLTREISVGSQNVYDSQGPNQGNTAATTTTMLKRGVGCGWVLLGHSDRRNNLGETDELISDKVRKSLDSGMNVILTIGELSSQRRWGLALSTLRKQLGVSAKVIQSGEWHRIVVAYEPVWAVGEGATPCSPKEAQRINSALRRYITKLAGADAAASCRLTYTGSVNEENAADYANLKDVDGFVVGRAGLDTKKLRSIICTLAQKGNDE